MNTLTVIVEKAKDGTFSAFIEDKSYPYGIIGTGMTTQEAVADFQEAYDEMKAHIEGEGEQFTEAKFIFKYDVPSFLQEYAYAFTLAGLERITGINQKQLGHYISGYRTPSDKTVRKIENGVHAFCEQLRQVRFV